MDDTPEHIKKLQLQIWLSKTPAERLRQFLIDNDTLFQFWSKAKERDADLKSKKYNRTTIKPYAKKIKPYNKNRAIY